MRPQSTPASALLVLGTVCLLMVANPVLEPTSSFAGNQNAETQPKPNSNLDKERDAADGKGFKIYHTTTTRRVQLQFPSDSVPGFPKLLNVRIGEGTDKSWLLPLFIPKNCIIDLSKPNETSVTVTLYDCLYHPQVFQGIEQPLSARLKNQPWDRAEPIGERVEVVLYAEVETSGETTRVPLRATNFLRGDNKHFIDLKFNVTGPANETLRNVEPKNLGLLFAESYFGQYRTDDLQATLTSISNTAMSLSNEIRSTPNNRQATLLICFGGELDQEVATKQLIQRTFSLDVFARQGKEINPALVENIITSLIGVKKDSYLNDQRYQNEVLTVLLSNGAKMTAAIGTFKRISEDIKKEVENKRDASDAVSNQNRKKYERDVHFEGEVGGSFLGTGGSVKAGGGDRTMEENDVQSAITKTRGSAARDLQQLAKAIDGDLPVAVLNIGQLQTLAKGEVDTSRVNIGTFVDGRKTLVHSFSFQQTDIKVIRSAGVEVEVKPTPVEVKPTPVEVKPVPKPEGSPVYKVRRQTNVGVRVYSNISKDELHSLRLFADTLREAGGVVVYVACENPLTLEVTQALFPNAKLANDYRGLIESQGVDFWLFCGQIDADASNEDRAVQKIKDEVSNTCDAGKDIFILADANGDSKVWSRVGQSKQLRTALIKTQQIASMGNTETAFMLFLKARDNRDPGNLNEKK